MIEFDKRDKETQYQEWKEKNGEFVERFTKEVLEKYGREFVEKSVQNYFNKIDAKRLNDLMYSGIYAEVQQLIKTMVGYYNQGSVSSYKGYDRNRYKFY